MASAGATSVVQLPENRVHLFRLQILIIDGGVLVLRNILDQILIAKSVSLAEYLKNERPTITNLRSRGIITKAQNDTLFPSGGKVPTTSDLDITLAICLLRGLKSFGLNKTFDWKNPPQSTDVSLVADIWRLKEYRNNVSHKPTTTGIPANEFLHQWNDIKQILVRRSPTALNIQQTIKGFKSCPLDPEEEKRVQIEIEKWKYNDADVDRMTEEVTNLKKIVTCLCFFTFFLALFLLYTFLTTEKEGDFNHNVSDLMENVGDLKDNVVDLITNVDMLKKKLDDIILFFSGLRFVTFVLAFASFILFCFFLATKNERHLTDNVRNMKEDFADTKKKIGDLKEYPGDEDNKGDQSTKTCDLNEGVINVSDLKDIFADENRRQTTEDKNRETFAYINLIQTEEEKYQERKKHLKEDLIEFYRKRHSKVQLSPLFEEKDTPMSTFYIRPEISKVKFLTEIFKTGSKTNREIYLSADAGLGKTTFSKYLATSWCWAQCSNEKDITSSEMDDKDCMGTFEFVFLVLLRDSKNLCCIDDLVFELIVSRLAHSEKFDKVFLQEMLNRENCLIILDGLDEWTHPDNPGKPCYTPRSTPHRNDRKQCTILTTTRPWKLRVLDLRNSNELEELVALKKLNYDSRVTLARRTIQRLKYIPNDQSLSAVINKFNEEIDARDIAELASVPLLLMYIICLWCDDVPIGNSKCELYVKIVELLLSRTTAKNGELQSSNNQSSEGIPKCFDGHEHCTKYFTFLISLGKLAYVTLFNDKQENMLVFDGSVARKYLSKQEMSFSLHTGILTEITTRTNTTQSSIVSFFHQTFQEFLAAIFISSQSNAQKAVLENFKSAQSIRYMSTVCQFVSRMNATQMCEISESFMHLINEDERTRENKTRTAGEYNNENPFYHLQRMLLSCLQTMPESENIQLYLQDLFIDEHSEQDLKLLSKFNKNSIKSLNINLSRTSRSLRDIILVSSLTDLNHLQKLYYKGDKEKEAEINCLLSGCLQSLSLSFCKLINYEENLSERLEQIQNLCYLDVFHITFSHENLKIFLNLTSSKKSLKKVRLSELHCNEHRLDCERTKLDLSQHSQLTEVELYKVPPLQLDITTPSLVDVTLWEINLGESSLLMSPKMLNIKCVKLKRIEMAANSLRTLYYEGERDEIDKRLKQMQNLEYLHISGFTFSHEILERLLNYISSKKTCREVKLSWLYCADYEKGCKEMKFDLSKSTQLTKVVLSGLPPLQLNITSPALVDVKLENIELLENSLLFSPEMLNIKHVNLWSIEISAESLVNNMKILEILPHSVKVEMYYCRIIPDTEYERFGTYIRSSQRFVVQKDDYDENDGTLSFVFNS